MDLLYTKLHPPPVHRKQVARQHLLEKLDAALEKRLTLVCAPAGYGKTTLLSQWINCRAEPTGWVSLDRSDNDLAQFLRYFLAALQWIEPNTGAHIPEMFPTFQSLPGPVIWMPLVNEIAASEREFVVILDDYQEVEDRAVHEALDYLIEHMPDNLHLILATRADPPLSLPRLRAGGQLTEIRLSDLRFSRRETEEFLNNVMNLGLSNPDMTALESRTEGWIASLQMAAIALRSYLSHQMDSPDLSARSEFIQSFTGSHRFILDYLVEEVLEHQPPDLQDFLLKTSILERFCGLLCDAVVGDIEKGGLQQLGKSQPAGSQIVNSQSILEHLESANLFIVPLDDERLWYRYHRLFSDLLRKRLWQMSPDLAPMLHDRASDWYEKQGFSNEAIHHALAAKSYERAAKLIEDHVVAILMRSEVRTFLNWMEKLPDVTIQAHPTLDFYQTWSLLVSGSSMKTIEQRLQGMQNMHDASPDAQVMAGKLAVLRAYLFLFQADFRRAAAESLQALADLPQGDRFLRDIATWILSMVRLSDLGAQDGGKSLDDIIRFSREIGNPLIAVAALSHQARLQMRQGRLQLARETLEQALQIATDPQGQRLPIASEALIVLGDLEREWNNLDKAESYLNASIELARQWNELSSFDAYYPLMRLRLAQGDMAAARKAIETAWKMAHNSDFSQIDDILADLQRATFFIAEGNADEAMRWAEKRGLAPGVVTECRPAPDERQDYIDTHLRKYENLVLTRIFLLQDRSGEALELLEPLMTQARHLDRTDLAIEIHILRALAFQHTGDSDQALEALGEALSLAEPGGYVRIFLDEGEPMTRLLRKAAGRGLAPSYIAKLLAVSGETIITEREDKSSQAHPLIEPLSERELEVLRLLASGLSNPEIANELIVAASTIQTHCKNIYGKLGVHRRWDAVQRGRELGLI
jgi:LuxR family maltose regulon positive regulatory protein